MSRPTPAGDQSVRRMLFARLVDDAAVFPPGLVPLPDAVRSHLHRRATSLSGFVGPLLVPATAASELRALAALEPATVGAPLPVGLIVRPGGELTALHDAVDLLRDDEHVLVTGVEVGAAQDLRPVLDLGLPIAVEVGAGAEGERGLDAVATLVDADEDVIAKFRTGATATWPWPTEQVLADVIHGVVGRGLALKLTGGLHHALRGTYGTKDTEPEEMHGLLNVMVATHAALHGAEADELAEILALTRSERLVETLATLPQPDAQQLRDTFVSFGCCDVTDPLAELAALGLIDIEETHP